MKKSLFDKGDKEKLKIMPEGGEKVKKAVSLKKESFPMRRVLKD